MAVSVPSRICGGGAEDALVRDGADVANITISASARPMSPTRLTTNAFFAAVAADGL